MSKAILDRLIDKGVHSAWAHIELVAEGGWFRNLLCGKEPWIEVALVDQRSLQLNPGIPKSRRDSMPPVPWIQENQGLWTVPVTDVAALVEWIDKCFVAVSGNPGYQASSWIDGL